MPSCCEIPSHAGPAGATGTLTIALAGNPNSGKTTIFNALTGLRQKVANYPGVTVEKKTGRCKIAGRWVDVIDLPGTYSLISRSPDEHVAMEVLRGLRPDTKAPDVVVVVVDASNLQRNLYLVSQLIEVGRPMVVALNMTDVAERRGIRVSPEALQKELGVPVVPIVGHKRRGIHELKEAILKASVAPLPSWPLPEAMKEELLLVGGGLAILDSQEEEGSGFRVQGSGGEEGSGVRVQGSGGEEGSGFRVQGSGSGGEERDASAPEPRALNPEPSSSSPARPRAWICAGDDARHLDRYQAIAERLLIGDRAGDVSGFATRPPVSTLLNGAMTRLQSLGIDPMQADIEAHYRWIDGVTHRVSAAATPESAPATGTGGVLPYATPKQRTLTDKVDSVLVHKVWGLLIFAAIMAGLFVSMFWLAAPVMDAIDGGVGALGELLTTKLNLSDGPLKSLITDGIFAGIGAVVVFVPQIALLFLFLAILEDSGYLARAAFLMDKLLSKVGLHGKSFIPLLSSFACAIPGIMAARTIENRRDRLATIFIAPFMSCSARLPVYALLIGAFFAGYSAFLQGGILLACYLLGIVAAVGTAWLFKKSFLKGPPQAFILELPTYKVPQVSQVARVVWSNTSKFLTRAGTIIFCLSVILWAMSYYPRLPAERIAAAELVGREAAYEDYRQRLVEHGDGEQPADEGPFVEQAVAAAQSEYSISGRIGHAMEPAIRPLGYDWKMGVGLVAAFAAREVFVSTLGITYAVGEVEDDTTSLSDAMKSDVYTSGPRAGRPVWTPLVAVSLLVWFVLAMQCMSTLAIVRRETGGWKWPLLMLVYMNALAYVASLAVYQVGSLIVNA